MCDISVYLDEALKAGKNILLEGQLGTLKDPDHGIYPMVTSSSTLAAYGAIGAGIPPYEIKEIYTVCKAYSSSVGAGAFVSEIFGDEADELRRRGGDPIYNVISSGSIAHKSNGITNLFLDKRNIFATIFWQIFIIPNASNI